MNGGVAGSTHAASLMAALAVGAGQYGGAQEVAVCVSYWQTFGFDLPSWQATLNAPNKNYQEDIWLPFEHAPGFDPNGQTLPSSHLAILNTLNACGSHPALKWLVENRLVLETSVGYPLALSGIAAAALFDLGFDEHQAAYLYLILRLPGASAHAIEQQGFGWKKFPFYAGNIVLQNDPGAREMPKVSGLEI